MASVASTSRSNAERANRRRPPRAKYEKVRRVQDDEDDPLPGENEEARPVRVRDVFGGLFRPDHHEGVSVDVEHYIHDKSFRSRLILLSIRNSKIGIRVLWARSLVTFIACVLYVVEATYYDYFQETGYFTNETANLSFVEVMRAEITALVLLSDKPWWLWGLQIFLSFVIFISICFKLYVTTTWSWRNNILTILNFNTIIMMFIPIIYWITILYPPVLKDLFVPLFLLCWPTSETLKTASIQLNQRSNIGSRPNQFKVKVVNLAIFMACFIYTWVCIIHHFARIDNHLTLFETLWFLVVTLTTVGYGDIAPKHWTGRILVMFFIISALVSFLPLVEELYESFQMQQKLHNSVGYAQTGKSHIVICSTELKPLVLRDLLSEFYSDPSNYEVHCVVLVEKELGHISQLYLSHPVWSRRITVLIGSPMKQADLTRARAHSAIACFVHTPRHTTDPVVADHYTILCSWAIRDYAPDCKLFVQILQPESKLHLEVADHVVCEGELKCALLANNSHCPGIVTLVTLLLHTFKPEKRNFSSEDYKLYSKCAACEIYDIRLGDSKYFHHFAGKNFLYCAVVAYRTYRVTLFAVQSASEKEMKLNPGVNHIMHEDDICYYIGFTKEEYSKVQERETPAVHNALWQACAGAAVMAMSTSGIDPLQLDDKRTNEEGAFDDTQAQNNETLADENQSFLDEKITGQPQSIPSLANQPTYESPYIRRPSLMRQAPMTRDLSHDTTPHGARTGLQLLHFHSRVNLNAKPVVKVNVLKHAAQSHPAISPTRFLPPREDKEVEVSESTFDKDPFHASEVTMETPGVETVIDFTDGNEIRHKSFSDSDSEAGKLHVDRGITSTPVKRGYSNELSLLSPPKQPTPVRKPETQETREEHSPPHHRRPTWRSVIQRATEAETREEHTTQPRTGWLSVIRRVTSRSAASNQNKNSHTKRHEDEVVLELEDIAEEEELEGLEDGHCGSHPGKERSTSTPDSDTHRESRYRCDVLPVSPYCGFEPAVCHLLRTKRTFDQLKFQQQEGESAEDSSGREEEDSVSQWRHEAVIAYCEECTDELYHFILPLRAHYLPPKNLKPLVIMFSKEPSEEFLDAMSWLPMVYYTVGEISNVNDWLKAGILKADSVVVFSQGHTGDSTDYPEHIVDAATIMAVKKLSKLFPNVSILSEITYRYNMRFMRFTACETYAIRNLAAIQRQTDHLTYLFMPQFASGRTFCTSMLDTLLYQTYVKPYLVDLVRQFLGCRQVQDSGFLWKVYLTEDLLELHTYDRLFQRLASAHKEVPLGIYRTVPIAACPEFTKIYHKDSHDDRGRINQFVSSRAMSLGLKAVAPQGLGLQSQSFLLINPPPKTELRASDIILVLKCAATARVGSKATPANANTNNNTSATTQPSSSGTTPEDCGQAKPHTSFTVPVECHM